MVEIAIVDRFGPICVDADDGGKLFEAVQEALDKGEEVMLAFEGVSTITSVFLNTAVGCLYAYFDKSDLERRLHWRGLDATDESMLQLVKRNAIRFYSAGDADRITLAAAAERAGSL
jgi:hypothetical protein